MKFACWLWLVVALFALVFGMSDSGVYTAIIVASIYNAAGLAVRAIRQPSGERK